MKNRKTVRIGLWCSDCFAFLEHKLVIRYITDTHAVYDKHCSQCKTKSGPITIDIGIWHEITQNKKGNA